MNQMVESPFKGSAVAESSKSMGALAHTDQQRAIAEVQAAMMIARMNPRDPVAAMDRILNACARPSLADCAVYTYSRGGSDVSGPSIRLAEAMAQQWGNIKTSVRELSQANGISEVQAIAWDLETGYQCDKVFHVPHIRYTKSGSKALTDPRDIYEHVANQGARRLRACILAVIPGDVTEAAVKQCETTMKTQADTSPEAMQKMVVAFEEFGVSKEQIEKRIQRRLDAIVPAQVVAMKKIYASLRDGMSTAADWFEFEGGEVATESQQQSRTESLKDKVRGRQQQQAQPEQPEAPAETENQHVYTYAEVAGLINKAFTKEEYDEACALIASVVDDDQRQELQDIAMTRADEFAGQ